MAVFGAGTVGLSAIMAARLRGCAPIFAVDIRESRLDLARELGATHCVNSGATDAVREIMAVTGRGVDLSLEACGSPKVLRSAVECLATPGTCGLVGGAPAGVAAEIDMQHLLIGRTVTGIVEGNSVSQQFIPALIAMHRQSLLPFDRLVRFYPFRDINEAAAAARSGEIVKPVLVM